MTEMRYSSNTHCARSISLQRTTPWTAGVWTGLDHCDERAPLLVIEFRGMPGRLVDLPSTRPSSPPEIEPEDPIANGLHPHAPEPSRVRARAAVIDRDER